MILKNEMTLWLFCLGVLMMNCKADPMIETIGQWESYEISFEAANSYDNPYTEVEFFAEFTDDNGNTLKRPGFWDGGKVWKVRFAPPEANRTYSWVTFANVEDEGLERNEGKVFSSPYHGNNQLLQKGFLSISEGKRNVVHRDGSPFLLVGDTPWALPFRGTVESVGVYAKDRQEKGFNATLLMTVQPDQEVDGPDSRTEDYGFGRGFHDLKVGHLNELNPEYFQLLDELLGILHDHEIVPVLQPVFQGFGWKGKNVLGNKAVPEEYVRYTKYLLARYGAMPVMYLVSADGHGKEPGIKETGEMLLEWDTYAQPRGIHYNPFDEAPPSGYSGDPDRFPKHGNKSYQEEEWLDFQWCQTGHGGEHILHKVEKMYHNTPVKAAANGEPTYERIGDPDKATGWWQGHESWSQWTSGGTMGVVYGAAGLWNWKLRTEEPGFDAWSTTNASWEEATAFEGSKYPGLFGKSLEEYDITDIELSEQGNDKQKVLKKGDSLFVAYLPEGGKLQLSGVRENLPVVFLDPKTGDTLVQGNTSEEATKSYDLPQGEPWVVIIGEKITKP
jgi:hypothetical protein